MINVNLIIKVFFVRSSSYRSSLSSTYFISVCYGRAEITIIIQNKRGTMSLEQIRNELHEAEKVLNNFISDDHNIAQIERADYLLWIRLSGRGRYSLEEMADPTAMLCILLKNWMGATVNIVHLIRRFLSLISVIYPV